MKATRDGRKNFFFIILSQKNRDDIKMDFIFMGEGRYRNGIFNTIAR